MRAFVSGGKEVPCDLEIVDGSDHDYWWAPPQACRRRPVPPTAILLHHTGGEGTPQQVYRVLRARKSVAAPWGLSCHFVVGADGAVWQFADVRQTTTYHGGHVNGHTVGIEVVSAGVADKAKGSARPQYPDQIRGVEMPFLRFWPQQVDAVDKLCRALCAHFQIPWRFPMAGGRVRRDTLDPAEHSKFRGILGHFHVSKRKLDPSPHLLDELELRACR